MQQVINAASDLYVVDLFENRFGRFGKSL